MVFHGIDPTIDWQAQIEKYFFPAALIEVANNIEFHQHMRFEVIDVSIDALRGKIIVSETLTTGKVTAPALDSPKKQILHGGAIAAIFDAASASLAGNVAFLHMALRALEDEEVSDRLRKLATLTMNVSYLQAAMGDAFFVSCQLVRAGSKTVVVESSVSAEKGDPLAVATSNFVY